jgi:type II secretory pathway component GspD/PulD (secretin)
MWSRLESLPMLMMGSLLTKTCMTFGLTFFLATLAGPPPPPSKPAPVAMKTVLIRVQNRDLDDVQRLLLKLKSDRGRVGVNALERMVRITDLPWFVERMRRLVHEVDESEASDHHIWTYRVEETSPDEVVQVMTRGWIDHSQLLPSPGVSKLLPANREQLLIVVADRDGYDRMERIAHQIDRPIRCHQGDAPDGPVELPIQSHRR